MFDVLMFIHRPLCHQQNKGLTPIKFLYNYKAFNKSYYNVTKIGLSSSSRNNLRNSDSHTWGIRHHQLQPPCVSLPKTNIRLNIYLHLKWPKVLPQHVGHICHYCNCQVCSHRETFGGLLLTLRYINHYELLSVIIMPMWMRMRMGVSRCVLYESVGGSWPFIMLPHKQYFI